jgi:hypothetical protein
MSTSVAMHQAVLVFFDCNPALKETLPMLTDWHKRKQKQSKVVEMQQNLQFNPCKEHRIPASPGPPLT